MTDNGWRWRKAADTAESLGDLIGAALAAIGGWAARR